MFCESLPNTRAMNAPESLAKGEKREADPDPRMPTTAALLRWVYVGRLSVATAIFVAAAFYFTATPRTWFLIVTLALVLSLVVTGISFYYTHIRGAPPTETFLYTQTLFDLGLATAAVHVTGGGESDFASL